MGYKHILSSYLNEEERVRKTELAKKRIYHDSMYELHLVLYPAIPEKHHLKQNLICYQTTLKEEKIRILTKLRSAPTELEPEEAFESIVETITGQDKGPLHMILDAKNWARLPLTENDEFVFMQHGLIRKDAVG